MPVAAGPGRRALVAGLLVVLVAAAVAGIVLRAAYRSEQTTALAEVSSQVRAEAALAEHLIGDHLKVMAALASSDDIRSGDPDRIQALIVRYDPIRSGFTGGMGWVDAAGASQASVIAGPRSGVSFAELAYFRLARAGTPNVGAVSPSLVADQMIVPFAVPSTDASGSINGVLVAAVRLDADGELVRALRLFDAEDYFVDREGRAVSGPAELVSPAAPGSWPPNPPGAVPPAAAARTDAFGRTGRAVAWAPVTSAGWTAVRSLPEDEVFASARRLALWGTIGVIGGALTALLVVVAIARRIERSAAAAAAAARATRRSDALAAALADIVAGATTADIGRTLVAQALPALGATSATLLLPAHGRLRPLAEMGHEVLTDADAGDVGRDDPGGGPAFRAMDTARPVVQQPGGEDPHRATVALPLVSGDAVLGVVEVGWPHAIDPVEVATLDVLVARAATAMERAQKHEAEHRAVVAFQQSVLPLAPGSITGVAVDACYSPADERFGAGGDWYDAIAIDDERLLLVIGDVVGHGVESAGTMGRLSTTVHTLARHGTHGPADILRSLDRLSFEHPDALCASVVCVLLDVGAGTCTYAIAGHLPPLALDRDGGVAVLDEHAGAVIGLDEHRREAVRSLGGVERLVLYTDGVVGRSEPIDDAVARLVRVARATHDDPQAPGGYGDRFRDAALRDLTRHDDVAVITARLEPVLAAGAPPARTMRFAAAGTAPGQARRFVRTVLGDAGLAHLVDDAELLVSELVANAVEHARTDGEVAVRVDGRGVRVEVVDARPGRVDARPAAPTATSGRGLWIVDSVATRWGVEATDGDTPGKRVWFELDGTDLASGSTVADLREPAGEPAARTTGEP